MLEGKVYDTPVIQLDISATALAAADVTVKPEWKLDGVNLLPFLAGKNSASPHEALYWRFGAQMAMRQGDWKLVRPDLDPKNPFGNVAPKPMLFNLKDDIGEKNDLAATQPTRVKEMREAWEKWNMELVPPAWQETLKPRK